MRTVTLDKILLTRFDYKTYSEVSKIAEQEKLPKSAVVRAAVLHYLTRIKGLQCWARKYNRSTKEWLQ